jgi:hypothetical protein
VMAPARSVFGDTNRNPVLVCSRLSTIRRAQWGRQEYASQDPQPHY